MTKALAVVDGALKGAAQNADLLARAQIFYICAANGRRRKSRPRKRSSSPRSIFRRAGSLARIHRDRGAAEQADEDCRWFVKTYTQRANDDMEITDPETLLLVGLAGCEFARYHNIADQFEFILTEVWGEAVKRDKDFWPADYEAGRLYQEKYNKAAASRALDRALTINPRAAEALAAKGYAALQRFETNDAELYAEQALKINPRLTEALRLRADLNSVCRRHDQSLGRLGGGPSRQSARGGDPGARGRLLLPPA